MTRYVVQVSRWHEVNAEDEERAEETALELDGGNRESAICVVTDLDAAEAA